MSDKFNIDKFLNEEPNEEPTFPQEGTDGFSNPEVPEDIKRVAQKAMLEKERTQFSNSPQSQPETHHFAEEMGEDEYPNSLKVSNIRFMGFRPEKPSVPENNATNQGVSNPFEQQAPTFETDRAMDQTLSAEPTFSAQDFSQNLRTSEPGFSDSDFSQKPQQPETQFSNQDFLQHSQLPENQFLNQGFLQEAHPSEPQFSNQNFSSNSPVAESQFSEGELSKSRSFKDDFMNRFQLAEDGFEEMNTRVPEERAFDSGLSNFEQANFSNVRPEEETSGMTDVHLEATAHEFDTSFQYNNEQMGMGQQANSFGPTQNSFRSYDAEQGPEEQKINRSERVKAEREEFESFQETKKKSTSHFGRNLAIVLFSLILLLGGGTYAYVMSSLRAVDSSNTELKIVEIPSNTSIRGVAEILEENDLIKNALIFNYYTQFTGNSDFKSGTFELSESMTAIEIAEALQSSSPILSTTGKVVIPEGYTLEQISNAITVNATSDNAGKSPFTSEEFIAVVTDPTFIQEMQEKYPELLASIPSLETGVKYQLEGYLFPATYEYDSNTTAQGLAEQMIDAMQQNIEPFYPRIAEMGMDVNRFISLAALVEKEANTEEDRKNVADVFLKRMNTGMTLGSNVALLYAEGKLGTNVTAEEDANINTSMESPYNLYQHQGTGPGPVANPSYMSLDAVANHTPNEFYYFLADLNTGDVYFAVTLEEHDANIAQYLSN